MKQMIFIQVLVVSIFVTAANAPGMPGYTGFLQSSTLLRTTSAHTGVASLTVLAPTYVGASVEPKARTLTATCVFAVELPVSQNILPANFYFSETYQFGQEAIEIEQAGLDLIPIEAPGLKRFDFRYMNLIDTSA